MALTLALFGALLTAPRVGLCAALPAIDDDVVGLALDRRPDLLTSVTLPDRSRDEVRIEPVEIGGQWRLVSTVGGVRTWETALPVRPRTLFFHKPPEGMALLQRDGDARWQDARTVAHRQGLEDANRVESWEFTTHVLRVRRALGAGRPTTGEYAVRYDTAVKREQALQRADFDGSDEAFVMRALQVDDSTRHGLFLPAPATVTFTLTVPDAGVLDLAPGLLPPEAAPPDQASDGADLVVNVDGDDIARLPLRIGQFPQQRVALARWAGREISLSLRTEPGDSTALDYVLVANPVVHSPQPDPPRVVVLFVDTLRQDGLSLYGYERQTTPRLDAWAEDARIFEQARSVAPWTLPSTRAMFLGTQPERWGSVPTLQERASAAGWATAFISGNVYLSSNFDMHRGWGTHRCINWPTADVQVSRARQWLAANPDRPALLVLHLMDMHLPYTEPRAYRDLFAGELPELLGSEYFQRTTITKVMRKLEDADKQYVRGRYDNNLRYVDDQLSDFIADLADDDIVVLLSDHGEEFWDHSSFEHGHSLYDELLRVPLVMRAPGLTPGRVAENVSLVDVAPTLAREMSLDATGMTGLALQQTDGQTLDERPVAFGRPLYGLKMWGVVDGTTKYTTSDGAERVFDLMTDSDEKVDLVLKGDPDRDGLAAAMATGLDRPVVQALRIEPSRSTSSDDLVVVFEVPGGVAHAWVEDDPLNYAEIVIDDSIDSRVSFTWKGRSKGVREAWLLPNRPLEEVLPELTGSARHKSAPVSLRPVRAGSEWPRPWTGRPQPLLRARAGGRTVTVGYGRAPLPEVGGLALSGVDAELAQDLKALGYFEDEDEQEPAP